MRPHLSPLALTALASRALAIPFIAHGGEPLGTAVTTYAECQRPTHPPLKGCPAGTLYVSQNRSSTGASWGYTTIQSAIESLPHDESPRIILIAPGTYVEQLNVTRAGPLTLLGTSDLPARGAAYAAAAGSDDADHPRSSSSNAVQVVWAAANGDSTGQVTDNAVTSVLTVAPTWNASLTGTGPTGFPVPADTPPGSRDFRAYNVDFRNTFSEYAAGPALALGVAYANVGFYGCGFYSYQDTVYVGKLGNALFYDCVVAGQVDFLYGFGTAWVEESTLALRGCGGGITAWKGTNTTFENKYGVYISSSRVVAANATIAPEIRGQCPLGRPWNALHRSVFADTYLDASIKPEGYIKWGDTDPRFDNTTFMAVYADDGPGYDEQAMRASNVTRVLDDRDVRPYRSPRDVFLAPDGTPDYVHWIDSSVRERRSLRRSVGL